MKIAIVNGFDVYEHRVDLLYNYFVKENYDVKVYTTNYLHREKQYRNKFNEKYNYVNARSYKKNMSFGRLSSHYHLAKDIFENLPEDLDLLWVIIPPNSFVKSTAKFKKKYPKTKVIVDILDMWPETLPVGKIKTYFPFTLWKQLRNKHLKYMDYIVTECDLFQEKLDTFVSKSNISTLYLSYKNVDNNSLNTSLLPTDKLSLCYLGSVNNIIDIECIENLITNLSKSQNVDLHIVGGGEKEEELIKKAQLAGANVIFHGKIYDNEAKYQIFNSCHYGLNIMKPTVFVGLTMKSIDYLKAGLPVINNIVGDTWDLVDNSDIGINTHNGKIDFHFSEYDISSKKQVQKFYMDHFSESVFYSELKKIIEIAIK